MHRRVGTDVPESVVKAFMDNPGSIRDYFLEHPETIEEANREISDMLGAEKPLIKLGIDPMDGETAREMVRVYARLAAAETWSRTCETVERLRVSRIPAAVRESMGLKLDEGGRSCAAVDRTGALIRRT